MNISSVSSPLNLTDKFFTNNSDNANDLKSKSGTQSFGQIVSQKLEEANSLQKNADQLTESFLTGGPVEIHQMLIAAEKADLALRQTVEVRDKLIDAYKQIANMQI